MDYYEKRYKDLVEAVKMLKEANPSDEGLQNWVKDNVPELQESEDEKIRKAIRLILIATEDDQKDFYETHKLTRKELTDWLEKQGEQKSAWSEEDECYMSECIGAIATKDGWSFEEKRKTKHWL